MKFFFECVSCCGSPRASNRDLPPTILPASASFAEERSSLVPTPRRHRRRKRPGSLVGEWQPSLCVISEDNVVVERAERMSVAGSERTVKRKAQQVHVRSYNHDDYGRNSYPMVIPAFSPTPFMV